MHRLSHIIGQMNVVNNSNDIHKNNVRRRTDYKYTLDSYSKGILTNEQRRFFEENGYLIIRNVLSLNDCCMLKNRFNELVINPSLRPSELIIMRDITLPKLSSLLSTNISEITRMQGLQNDTIFLKYYLKHRKLVHYAQAFVGYDIRCWQANHIQKPPDNGLLSSRHPLHQDMWYMPISNEHRMIACWTALEFVGRRNGGLCVIPGSHKENKLYIHDYPSTFNKNAVNFKYYGVPRNIYNSVAAKRIHLEMNAGDTVFYNPLLIHGSGANLSNGTRNAVFTHYLNSKICNVIHYKYKQQRDGTTTWKLGKLDKQLFNKYGTTELPYSHILSTQIQGDVGNFKLSDQEIQILKKYYFKRDVDESNWK